MSLLINSMNIYCLFFVSIITSIENRKFFNMEAPGVADAMGFPYDHKSLLHFDAFKYSTGFDPTIKSKIPGVQLGNKIALTVQDISMINTLYTECKSESFKLKCRRYSNFEFCSFCQVQTSLVVIEQCRCSSLSLYSVQKRLCPGYSLSYLLV